MADETRITPTVETFFLVDNKILFIPYIIIRKTVNLYHYNRILMSHLQHRDIIRIYIINCEICVYI